jgi:hypothetical protein
MLQKGLGKIINDKIINDFVCQRMGGKFLSWLYLVSLAVLSKAMSLTTSAAPICLILMGCEVLSSIRWMSICHVMMQQYRQQPELMVQGIAIIISFAFCSPLPRCLPLLHFHRPRLGSNPYSMYRTCSSLFVLTLEFRRSNSIYF